jgi:hypothetical protein
MMAKMVVCTLGSLEFNNIGGILVFGLWSLVFGLWSLVFGLWSLVFGLWSLVFGLWSLRCCFSVNYAKYFGDFFEKFINILTY